MAVRRIHLEFGAIPDFLFEVGESFDRGIADYLSVSLDTDDIEVETEEQPAEQTIFLDINLPEQPDEDLDLDDVEVDGNLELVSIKKIPTETSSDQVSLSFGAIPDFLFEVGESFNEGLVDYLNVSVTPAQNYRVEARLPTVLPVSPPSDDSDDSDSDEPSDPRPTVVQPTIGEKVVLRLKTDKVPELSEDDVVIFDTIVVFPQADPPDEEFSEQEEDYLAASRNLFPVIEFEPEAAGAAGDEERRTVVGIDEEFIEACIDLEEPQDSSGADAPFVMRAGETIVANFKYNAGIPNAYAISVAFFANYYDWLHIRNAIVLNQPAVVITPQVPIADPTGYYEQFGTLTITAPDDAPDRTIYWAILIIHQKRPTPCVREI